MKNSTSPENGKGPRELPLEKKTGILNRVRRADTRAGEGAINNSAERGTPYMRIIVTDEGLEALIKKNRVPQLFFYPSSDAGIVHVVFPPSPLVSRRNNRQQITCITPPWESEKRYVFHSERYRGVSTECSYGVVDFRVGITILKRIIAILEQTKGREADAKKYSAYLQEMFTPLF